MTELRKICPNSGKSCDCPKGQCLWQTRWLNIGDSKETWEPKLHHEQAHEHDAEQLAVYQQAADQLCEQARIDRQEAGSLKYALCAQILLLSSGKFALFGPYSMQDGIPLLAIDTWAALESHVRAYRKTAEEGYQQEKLDEERRRNTRVTKAAVDYDSLFSEEI